jgi:hypothetical protein
MTKVELEDRENFIPQDLRRQQASHLRLPPTFVRSSPSLKNLL